jgi:hypothetical protein
MKQLAILFSIMLFVACDNKSSDVTEPFEKVSTTPVFIIKSVNSTVIDNYGELVFTIEYIDGDGDLGSEDADEKVLFVVDSRDNITSGFHVRPLNPEANTAKVITGLLQVNLDNVLLLEDTTSNENAKFTIFMYDQAGHKSNEVVSPTITINR